jgi:hypothetical protein
MSEVQLSANTLQLVRHIFPPEDRAAVIAALEAQCGSGLPLWAAATPEALERIRFAVLKLSSGSLPEFERTIAIANRTGAMSSQPPVSAAPCWLI